MTAERHGVAAKVIATVDDLDRIAADDKADVPALHGWRRRAFRRKGAGAQARQALACDRTGPRGGDGPEHAGFVAFARAAPRPTLRSPSPRFARRRLGCSMRTRSNLMASFLRNQWSTAATSAELRDKPLARTICNEPLVLFRSRRGRGGADRPLSAPQGAIVLGRGGRRHHPVRLSRPSLCPGWHLHARSRRRADRTKFSREELSRT